jgi:hypothetical protein
MERTYHLGWNRERAYYHNQNHKGVVTVVSNYNEEDSLLQLGFSFCSPKDHFSRKFGRKQAKERLEKIPLVISCLIPSKSFIKDIVRFLTKQDLQHLHKFTPILTVPKPEEGFRIPQNWLKTLIKKREWF